MYFRTYPDFPRGFPITSTAAFPLVFDSWSRGMYAISLHGSNREYLAPFDRMFWAAPTITASMSGVVPILAVIGAKNAGKRLRLKNIAPVTSRVTGVMRAATPQPKR